MGKKLTIPVILFALTMTGAVIVGIIASRNGRPAKQPVTKVENEGLSGGSEGGGSSGSFANMGGLISNRSTTPGAGSNSNQPGSSGSLSGSSRLQVGGGSAGSTGGSGSASGQSASGTTGNSGSQGSTSAGGVRSTPGINSFSQTGGNSSQSGQNGSSGNTGENGGSESGSETGGSITSEPKTTNTPYPQPSYQAVGSSCSPYGANSGISPNNSVTLNSGPSAKNNSLTKYSDGSQKQGTFLFQVTTGPKPTCTCVPKKK